MGLGANDLMDLLANTVGALIGAAAATFVLIVRDAIVDRRLDRARMVKVVVSVLLGAAVLVGGPVWAASQRQALGVRLMMGTFGGTTLADYQASRATTWESKLFVFWEATGQPTMISRDDTTRARERATWNIYFAVVCVVGEWTPSGFTAVPLSGQACNDPLELDS